MALMPLRKALPLGLLLVACLTAAGCLLSGTFVVVYSFAFTTQTGFYPVNVDLTGEDEWNDHKDDIDVIEAVGFELWITNNEPQPWSFAAWIDDASETFYDVGNQTGFDASNTKILIFDTLTVPASTGQTGSQRFVSYAESLTLLRNMNALKQMVKTGKFHFYGLATANNGGVGGQVDSVRIIVTLSASDT